MKICILTQNIGYNYGGILQAYALQAYLRQEGHIVETVHHRGDQRITFRLLLSIVKRIIKKYLLRRKTVSILPVWINKKKQNVIYEQLDSFIKHNIIQTPYIKDFKQLNNRNYEAYIVGSDQVWRPKYNKYLFYEMFLSFVKVNIAKKISYAASFGVSEMEFSKKQIHKASMLLQKFNAVSVREDTGIDLCRDYFHVEVQRVLDPTMLLLKEDYLGLIADYQWQKAEREFFVYVLDQSSEISQMIGQIGDKLQYIPYYFLPKTNQKNTVMPSVISWLKGFAEAKFVITDSFHGTVFSILFNKSFLVYANQQRGVTRFTSLLKMFHLEDRLVMNLEELIVEKIKMPIDWGKVNQIIEKERIISSTFLKNALK